MKVKVTKFDEEELLNQIDNFISKQGIYPNYLVMNRKTEYLLIANYYDDDPLLIFKMVNKSREFHGIKIAYNDSLEFGFVDIV